MALKKKHEEHENLERWLVSYADFITLLFAFFTVLYALSQTDKAKYKAAAESIQRAFMSSGGIFPLKGAPMQMFDKAPDKGTRTPVSPSDAGRFSKDNVAMEKMKEEMENLFQKSTGLALRHGDIEVYRSETGFKIRLNESLLYSSGSAKIRRAQTPFLYEISKRLSRLDLPIQIEGHSDNQRGNDNWQLSISRSYNVVKFMMDGAGFPKNRISAAGYGDSQPLADNDSSEGRARNRRVEISVISGDREISSLNF